MNATGTITVTADMTAGAASSTPTLCINTPLTNITHATTLATGIANDGVDAANGLPAGVSATWAGDVITISGTPSAAGVFNYSIALTGGCGTVNATGTITVTADMTAGAASSTPTLCINTPLTNITHATTLATGIANDGVDAANGLPAGVSATWAGDVITISGTPSAAGVFNYSIALTGGCGTVNATGTITVNVLPSPTAAGSTDVNENCTYTYNTASTGNNFVWSVTGGNIDSGQGTNEITVTWDTLLPAGTLSGPGTVEVEETIAATGCADTSIINITIHRLPQTGPVNHIDETKFP